MVRVTAFVYGEQGEAFVKTSLSEGQNNIERVEGHFLHIDSLPNALHGQGRPCIFFLLPISGPARDGRGEGTFASSFPQPCPLKVTGQGS